MDDVKLQLRLYSVASLLGLRLGDLHADYQLAHELFGIRSGERETEDVGGLVVLEVTLVETMDGRIVHEGQAYVRVSNLFAFEYGPHQLAHARPVDGDDLLRTGDGDLAHEAPRQGRMESLWLDGHGSAKAYTGNTIFTAEDAEERRGRQAVNINEISGHIGDAAMKVHTALGPGLLESAYEGCLFHELSRRGLRVTKQVGLPVVYEGVQIDVGYRIDLLVEDLVIVEIKSVEALAPVHEAQLLTYMKLSGRKLGLLINFNVLHLKDGIKRRVMGL